MIWVHGKLWCFLTVVTSKKSVTVSQKRFISRGFFGRATQEFKRSL